MNNIIKIFSKYKSNHTSLRSLNTLVPWSKQKNIYQKKIINANGPFLYTEKERILEFTSGAMVVNLGHNNSYIQEGLKQHINSGIAYVPSNFSTEQRERLSKRLLDEADMKNGKVLYCNAGADANEMASFISKE